MISNLINNKTINHQLISVFYYRKENHEKSKKHKEKVNLLKLEMLNEMENDDQTPCHMYVS